MTWLKKSLFVFVLLLFCLPEALSQDTLSVREQAQNELLNLKIQLINCGKAINSLKSDIETLKEIISNYEATTNDLEEQLKALEKELQTRTALYAKLLNQVDDLKKYIGRLETENTLLWIGGGSALAAAIIATICAVAK